MKKPRKRDEKIVRKLIAEFFDVIRHAETDDDICQNALLNSIARLAAHSCPSCIAKTFAAISRDLPRLESLAYEIHNSFFKDERRFTVHCEHAADQPTAVH
jgi:hypothetical protein